MQGDFGDAADTSIDDEETSHLPSTPALNLPKLMCTSKTQRSLDEREIETPSILSPSHFKTCQELGQSRDVLNNLSAITPTHLHNSFLSVAHIRSHIKERLDKPQPGKNPIGPLKRTAPIEQLNSPHCKPSSMDDLDFASPSLQRREMTAGGASFYSYDYNKELQQNLRWRASDKAMTLRFTNKSMCHGVQLNPGHESTLEPQMADQSIFEEFVRHKIQSEAPTTRCTYF